MREVRSNKEILDDLIKKIQEIKRITQGKISLLAGYETENYLSEAKSTNNVTDNIIRAVNSLYKKAKENPDVLIVKESYSNPDHSMMVSEPFEQLMNMKILQRENETLKETIKMMKKENAELYIKIGSLEEKLKNDHAQEGIKRVK
ncbi:MAG TPA: hypothetical protein VN726_22945 [Hanamia sp.]|nr:hypothetical protein [Hanamia sp.]